MVMYIYHCLFASEKSIHAEFCGTLDRFSDGFPDGKLCVVGDFNIPNAQWSSGDLALVDSSVKSALPNEIESIQVLSNII